MGQTKSNPCPAALRLDLHRLDLVCGAAGADCVVTGWCDIPSVKVFRIFCVSLAVVSLITACASKPKVDPNRDWSALIGTYSFAQALAELGTPATTGASPEGRFAEWTLKRSPQMSFGVGMGTGSYGRHGGVGVGTGTSITPPPRGEYLRLDFGTNDLLQSWAKTKY